MRNFTKDKMIYWLIDHYIDWSLVGNHRKAKKFVIKQRNGACNLWKGMEDQRTIDWKA